MLDPYRACLWTRGPVAISCSWSDDRMNPKPHNLARACTNMSTHLDIADPVITIGDSDSEASKTVSTLFRCCSACREPSMSCGRKPRNPGWPHSQILKQPPKSLPLHTCSMYRLSEPRVTEGLDLGSLLWTLWFMADMTLGLGRV